MNRTIDEVLGCWDRLDAAAKRVETSLPFQMTGAIAELISARESMRETITVYAMQVMRAPHTEDR